MYKKYVKPLISALEPEIFETSYGKRLKKCIFNIANPLFALKSRKEQRKALLEFNWNLFSIYRISILAQYRHFDTDDKDSVTFWTHEYASSGYLISHTGDKNKALVSVGENEKDAVSIPKKYRGIIGRQKDFSTITVNRSDAANNASHLWFVPRKGVHLDELRSIIGIFNATDKDVDRQFKVLLTLTQKMRFRNVAKHNNQPRTGAKSLAQELATDLKSTARYARAYDELQERINSRKELELCISDRITQRKAELPIISNDASQLIKASLAKGVDNLSLTELQGIHAHVADLMNRKRAIQEMEAHLVATKHERELYAERLHREIAQQMGLQR